MNAPAARRAIFWAVLTVAVGPGACKSDAPTPSEADADTDSDSDADTDTDTDTDSDADADTDTEAGCADDANEPNDFLPDAVPIEDVVDPTSLVVCDDYDDFWEITVEAGEELTVAVYFDGGIADIDLALLESSGAIIDESESTGDDESIVWFNDTGAAVTVFARVWVYTPGGANIYELDISRSTCTDDAAEPNDELAAATPTSGVTGHVLLATNEDWYALSVPDQALLEVGVVHDPDEGDIDIELVRADGTVIDFADTNDGTERVTTFNGSGAAETVYLRTYFWALAQSPCNTYDVDVVVTPQVCVPDANEPNDTNIEPTDLAAAAPASITWGDTDWYAVTVAAGGVVELSTTADPGLDLEIELTDAFGGALDRGDTVSYRNASELPVVVLAGISAVSGACGDYSLVTTDRTPVCAPDAHEDDDAPNTPGSGSAGAYTLYPDDPDHFGIVVEDGQVAAAVLTWDPIYGHAELQALSALNATLVAVDSGGSPASVRLPGGSPVAGYVVGVVEPAGLGICLPYALDLVFQTCGENDAHEPNETAAEAMALAEAAAVLDDGEHDWFALPDVPGGSTLQVSVDFLHVLGDIDAELVGPTGVLLDRSQSATDGESLVWTNAGAAGVPVKLHVYGYGTSGCSTPYSFVSGVQ